MAFDNIQAELGLLLTTMQNEPADRHELYLQIMQKLNELKAYGCRFRRIWSNLRGTSKQSSRPTRARLVTQLVARASPPNNARRAGSNFPPQ